MRLQLERDNRMLSKIGHGPPYHNRPEAMSSLRLFEKEGQLDENLDKLPSRTQEAPPNSFQDLFFKMHEVSQED